VKPSVRQWILVVALSPLAAASDWYVDANAGNNANSGTAPSQAWRTISFAVSQVPTSGIQRIFVAAGTYDSALGESWPVMMRDKLQIIGVGPASTTLVGGNPGLIRFVADSMPRSAPARASRGFTSSAPAAARAATESVSTPTPATGARTRRS
jgi:hypothetical protein